ncbi:MAG: hypothetical protein ACRCXT_24200 [Paraclostridium sp.]
MSEINIDTEINFEESYNTLKSDYDSLVEKHNSLEKEYGDYKLDNDIASDIRANRLILDDNDMKLLKDMRQSNIESYNTLIESFKVTKQSKVPYFTTKTSGSDNIDSKNEVITFGSAIKNRLGVNK